LLRSSRVSPSRGRPLDGVCVSHVLGIACLLRACCTYRCQLRRSARRARARHVRRSPRLSPCDAACGRMRVCTPPLHLSCVWLWGVRVSRSGVVRPVGASCPVERVVAVWPHCETRRARTTESTMNARGTTRPRVRCPRSVCLPSLSRVAAPRGHAGTRARRASRGASRRPADRTRPGHGPGPTAVLRTGANSGTAVGPGVGPVCGAVRAYAGLHRVR
jgi:hypothetical protein